MSSHGDTRVVVLGRFVEIARLKIGCFNLYVIIEKLEGLVLLAIAKTQFSSCLSPLLEHVRGDPVRIFHSQSFRRERDGVPFSNTLIFLSIPVLYT